MYTFSSLTVLFGNLQSMLHMNAFNDQHTILSFFDFPPNLSCQLSVRLNFARLQRAPEGSKQSTRDRCN
jgi:hypothetical protein